MSLAQDFDFNASLLNDVGWQEATCRLVDFHKWMKVQPEIGRVLDELRSTSRVFEILRNGGPRARNNARAAAGGAREAAALGLAMMELCSVETVPRFEFHQIAYSFGVQFPPNSAMPHEHLCVGAMRLYIRPLVNWIKREISRDSVAITSGNIAVTVQGHVTGGIQVNSPNSSQTVILAAASLIENDLSKLKELLADTRITAIDREDALQALERVAELSKREKTDDALKRANEKLDFVKRVFEVYKDIADVAAPYIASVVRLLGQQ